jgi:hypothetical protein
LRTKKRLVLRTWMPKDSNSSTWSSGGTQRHEDASKLVLLCTMATCRRSLSARMYPQWHPVTCCHVHDDLLHGVHQPGLVS